MSVDEFCAQKQISHDWKQAIEALSMAVELNARSDMGIVAAYVEWRCRSHIAALVDKNNDNGPPAAKNVKFFTWCVSELRRAVADRDTESVLDVLLRIDGHVVEKDRIAQHLQEIHQSESASRGEADVYSLLSVGALPCEADLLATANGVFELVDRMHRARTAIVSSSGAMLFPGIVPKKSAKRRRLQIKD